MGSRNNLHRVIVIRVPLMYYVLHGILWTYFIHYYSFKIYIYLKAIGNTLNRIYQYIYNYILDIYLLTPTHTETATHPHTHTPNTPPAQPTSSFASSGDRPPQLIGSAGLVEVHGPRGCRNSALHPVLAAALFSRSLLEYEYGFVCIYIYDVVRSIYTNVDHYISIFI